LINQGFTCLYFFCLHDLACRILTTSVFFSINKQIIFNFTFSLALFHLRNQERNLIFHYGHNDLIIELWVVYPSKVRVREIEITI
jgi:hypothetical protein